MSKSLKAALLSGLVFPGTGHIFLKQYKKGIALVLIALLGLLVIVIKSVHQALVIIQKMELKAGAININDISKATTEATANMAGSIFYIAFMIIIFSWIYGIVDAYKFGKRKERELFRKSVG